MFNLVSRLHSTEKSEKLTIDNVCTLALQHLGRRVDCWLKGHLVYHSHEANYSDCELRVYHKYDLSAEMMEYVLLVRGEEVSRMKLELAVHCAESPTS